MKAFITKLLEQFDARTLRERVLIGLTVFAVTWGIWIASIGGAVIDSKVEVVTNIDQLTKDMMAQDRERQLLLSEDRSSQRLDMRAKQNKLKEMVVARQIELDELLTRFVPPEEVPELLEDVLDDFSGLKLIRLSSRPAEPLLLKASIEQSSGHDVEDAQEAEPQVKIYRHPVRMEFEGSYAEVIAYLDALENARWRFAWRKLEYVVAEYPRAQVLIELETLSREKEWLGV